MPPRFHGRVRLLLLLFLGSASALELYERLGLAKSASAKEIKKAWHLLALKLHPDKVEGNEQQKEEATAKFKAAAEAYEVLSEPTLLNITLAMLFTPAKITYGVGVKVVTATAALVA